MKHEKLTWLFAILLLCTIAGCKSKQIATTQATDSIAVHNLSCKDSLRIDYNFQFDELLVYKPPLSPPKGEDVIMYSDSLTCAAHTLQTVYKNLPLRGQGGFIYITKGSTSSAIVRTEEKATCDSTKVDSMKYEEPIPKPPKKSTCFWLIALLIGLIILIIMSRYK